VVDLSRIQTGEGRCGWQSSTRRCPGGSWLGGQRCGRHRAGAQRAGVRAADPRPG